ncbi:MAG: S1C family serine protease [bacterium]|jgi:serine protease Do
MPGHFWDGWSRERSMLTVLVVLSLCSALAGGLVAVAGTGLVYGRYFAAPHSPATPGLPEGAVAAEDDPAGGDRVVEAVDAVIPTVVGITNKAVMYDWLNRSRVVERGSGSGVVFHPDGYIATNNHVVEGAQELVVTMADGRSLPGHLVGRDARTDLAVVRIQGGGFSAAEFGDSATVRVGETAIAVGSPLGFEQTVTVGVISAINRSLQVDERTMRFLQTDAAINAGNSGGPLLNIRGQVIGINTAKIPGPGIEGLGFAIPTNLAKPILDDLINNGRVVYPWLGVSLADRETLEEYGYQVDFAAGVYVVRPIAGGPAAKAGIKAGDVIITVAGENVNTVEELQIALQNRKVGEIIAVGLQRDGHSITVNVALREAPEE